MREHVAVRCKPTTARNYRLVLDCHLLPALGCAASRRDRARACRGPALQPARDADNGEQGGRHALALVLHGRGLGGSPWRGGNPCKFLRKYRERSCERFLSEEEFRRLGRVLGEVEGKVCASAVAAFRRALAGSAACTCRYTAPAGQPLGDCRGQAGRAVQQSQQHLARGAHAGGSGGRSYS